MQQSIGKLTIEGFKSIRELKDFQFRPLNVLIGANGCGKSNFLSFFSLAQKAVKERLELTVNKAGGSDTFLFMGPKETEQIIGKIYFGPSCSNGYEFNLEPTADNRLIFKKEKTREASSEGGQPEKHLLGSGHSESLLSKRSMFGKHEAAKSIYDTILSWAVYHFHDTSGTAGVRRKCYWREDIRLEPDAGNLAAFLYMLREKHQAEYNRIRDAVQLVAPFFDDFVLRPMESENGKQLELEWKQVNSNHTFHASQFSDGTLRFIALATALLQGELPLTIFLDEPELGLHPYALEIIANLISQASENTQLIVSTQSPTLLNVFEPRDIVVIDRQDKQSRFRRLCEDELKYWLDEQYTLGDLWQKNVYGGSPNHE